MGIEALSRGASSATFIDNDRRATKCIQDNVTKLGLADKATILCIDALQGLKKLSKDGKQFSLIYIDPPYTHIGISGHSPLEILSLVDSLDLLQQEALVFVEEASPESIEIDKLRLTKLKYKKTRKFSSSLLHQFIYQEARS
jgi:16S rRNA (guanine(966)-N(2))-methyltransferase RsmD